MRSVERRRPGHSLAWVLLPLVAAAAISGCNQASSTRQDQLEQTAKLPNKMSVAKFAGHVTIDGQAPSPDAGTVFVILTDPQHVVPGGKAQTACDDQGNFAFTTYVQGDGAPTGKYVVTFVQLKPDTGGSNARGGGRRMGGLSMTRDYGGEDGLKNLYNDPDKNKDNPKFNVEITDPGKTDYDFNLEVAGKEPVKTAGPNAALKMKTAINPKM